MNAGPEERSRRVTERGSAHVVDLADPTRGDDADEFQRHHLDANVSFIVVDEPPGGGPRLHRHPYEEVFVVQEGTAIFTAGDTTGSDRTGARSRTRRPCERGRCG